MIRRNRRWLTLFAAFSLFSSWVCAQPLSHMHLDSVRFYDANGNTRFEIPLSIIRSRLYYRNDSAGNRFTTYRFQMRVFHDTASPAIETWDRVHHPLVSEGTGRGFIPDLAVASLPPGMYRIEVDMTDSANHFHDRKTFDSLRITPAPTQFTLSGLMICSDIEQENGTDEFHRNGFRVVPYAEKMFGSRQPILYLYWEQYKQFPDTLCQYTIAITAARSATTAFPMLTRQKHVVSDRGFAVEAVPVRDLPTGSYVVQVIAKMLPSGLTDTTLSRFFVLSDSLPAIVQKADTMRRATNEDVVPLQDIHYIVDQPTLDAVSKLSLEEQRIWVENYWKDNDPTPRTPLNEKMEDYRKRLEAVERFKTRDKEGWQTDRGRVYMMYGPPDDIEDNAFQTSQTSEIQDDPSGGNKPFTVWRYNSIAGGVYFIFGDVNLFGDYLLLHSTMPGEKTDEFWFRRLKGIK